MVAPIKFSKLWIYECAAFRMDADGAEKMFLNDWERFFSLRPRSATETKKKKEMKEKKIRHGELLKNVSREIR